MDEVCDVKDCPMYGYFTNMAKHPINEKMSELNKKSKTVEDHINNIYVGVHILANNTRLRVLCSSCCHFRKIDMSQVLIKEEAKKVLSEE